MLGRGQQPLESDSLFLADHGHVTGQCPGTVPKPCRTGRGCSWWEEADNLPTSVWLRGLCLLPPSHLLLKGEHWPCSCGHQREGTLPGPRLMPDPRPQALLLLQVPTPDPGQPRRGPSCRGARWGRAQNVHTFSAPMLGHFQLYR